MRKILKESLHFIAEDFAKDTYNNEEIFLPLGIMRGEGIMECSELNLDLKVDLLRRNEASAETIQKTRQKEWDSLIRRKVDGHGDHQGQFLQELGFIEWARNYYPKSFTVMTDNSVGGETTTSVHLNHLHQMPPPPRILLPFCGYFVQPINFGIRPLHLASNAMYKLEKQVPSKNIFYVSPHPGTKVNEWYLKINNARKLQIDQCTQGFFNDIIIPISMHPSDLHYFSSTKHNVSRTNLLYSCGAHKNENDIYDGFREKLPLIFNSLNKPGIDMSSERTKKEYDLGFHTSKFCLIIPGDTTATSQAFNAMIAGCVPIFIAIDFRDLPFADILNYKSFSLRVHTNYFVTGNSTLDENRASKLYHDLEDMVQNGKYDELRKKVEVTSDFFNYHRFGSRSPYGAALASMYQDEVNENS